MKVGIVCEGGGMRGIFTAGVLQAFMDEGFVADELVGVSAGASNGASYVSAQAGRGLRTNVDYVGDKRYLSFRSYLRTGSVFGMDFIFGTIPEQLDPFDFDAFNASACDYWAGATDVHTGRIAFFGKPQLKPGLAALRASCSMPMFSNMVAFEGGLYLDGGVADPIPIDKALDDGCDRLLVVLTRDRAYRKKPQGGRPVYRFAYRHYPALVRAMEIRHLVYNHSLERLARLEAEGVAVVAAPKQPLAVDRFGQDKDKLLDGYAQGLEAGHAALAAFRA